MIRTIAIVATCCAFALAGCNESQQSKVRKAVAKQQSQYNIAQPVPAYDYSLERDLLIQLYNVRNNKVSTHSVWRSNYGNIEGDCSSMGCGLPYDTSLTNPLQAHFSHQSATTIGQAEPNGVYASTNTSATWVFCIGSAGILEPVYVESKVTVYPGPVVVDYTTNRVTRQGKATVTLKR